MVWHMTMRVASLVLLLAAICNPAGGQTGNNPTILRMSAQEAFLPISHSVLRLAQQPDNSAPRPSTNPIPDGFTNLQVFPKDISKSELVGVMKQLSITFKVRCLYCHAVSDDLTTGSFSSDEKDTKVKARELIRMIQAIRSVDSKPTGGTSRRTPKFLQKRVSVESAPLIAGR